MGFTGLRNEDLIMPYFAIEGKDKKEPVASMPGIYRLSLDNLLSEVKKLKRLGVKRVLLFGICDKKDKRGSQSYSEAGVVQKAVRAVKKQIRGLTVITDVCLCGYTSHGHCGILKNQKSKINPSTKLRIDGERSLGKFRVVPSEIEGRSRTIKNQRKPLIDNNETLKVLAKIAVSHAKAGADFVAPSAMMDFQVKAIRKSLDKNGFNDTRIFAYSAKYASNFYGPFREALGSAPAFGDRRTYQMDFRNSDEALTEIRRDIDEGADIVMVKPALAYLDVIYRAKKEFDALLAAYNVSGEYSMLKAAAKSGIINEKEIVLETLTAIKRAGADLIITYYAKEIAKWLKA